MLMELLSATYEEIRHNPAAEVPAGTLTLMEDTWGFPIAIAPITPAKSAFVTKAEKARVVKITGVVIKEGEAVYYIAATNNVTNVASTNVLIGYATEDVASAILTMIINFNGYASFLKA